MLLFVVGKINSLQGLSLCEVFLFQCFKIPFNHQYFLFFSVRFRNLKGTEYHGS